MSFQGKNINVLVYQQKLNIRHGDTHLQISPNISYFIELMNHIPRDITNPNSEFSKIEDPTVTTAVIKSGTGTYTFGCHFSGGHHILIELSEFDWKTIKAAAQYAVGQNEE